MLKRRVLGLVLSLFFIFSCVSVPASAWTVNGNEVLRDFIITTPRPYVVPYYQSGNQTIPWNRGYGQLAGQYVYTSGSGFYPWLKFSNAPNSEQYSWTNSGSTATNHVDAPFPSLGYAGSQSTVPSILVLPRFSESPSSPSSSTSILPYSVVFTIPQPTTEYHGLSISFSQLNFVLNLSAPDGYPSFDSYITDSYASILINGKTFSTVRFTSSTSTSASSKSGLTDIVTLDVTNRDIVTIVFSAYPPTVFQTSQPRSFRLYTSLYYCYGRYKIPTFPLNVQGVSYPLQYCWYNTSTTPDFSDGFTGGVPGDYDPGSGGGSGGGDNSVQLQEIQDSLTALGTSLDEYNSNVESMVTDINQGLDKVDQTIKDGQQQASEERKGILQAILDLPKTLLDGLVHVFVPTEEDMTNIKAEYDALLEEKLGLGYQAVELIDTIVTSVVDNLNSSTPYEFTFPGIQFPMNGENIVVLPETPVSLDNKVMDVLRPVAGTAVTLISILAFVNMLKNFLENLLSGKGVADFDGSG